MSSNPSSLLLRIALAAFSVLDASCCYGQTAGHSLDYETIIACNVAVDLHYLHAFLASSTKPTDNKIEDRRTEEAEKKKWVSLALASGKPPDDIARDFRKAEEKDDNQKEWDRLQDVYEKSDPSVRLMPYYVHLSQKERAEILKRRDALFEEHLRQVEVKYQQCVSQIQ